MDNCLRRQIEIILAIKYQVIPNRHYQKYMVEEKASSPINLKNVTSTKRP